MRLTQAGSVVVQIIALLALGCSCAMAQVIPQQYVGKVWAGLVVQDGSTNYIAEISLTQNGGTSSYPSLGCGGNLQLLSVDLAKNQFHFQEGLTSGFATCIDQVPITLQIDPSTSAMAYTASVKNINIGGTLLPPPPGVPGIIKECDGGPGGNCGTWTWNVGHYDASWANGALGALALVSFDGTGVQFLRTDNFGVTAGLTAVYTGTISSEGDSITSSKVIWTWPGHAGFPSADVWTATWGLSCSSLVNVTVSPAGPFSSDSLPTSILATFTPNFGLTLDAAAKICGVTEFNWQEWIDTIPSPSPLVCRDPTVCKLTSTSADMSITAPPKFLDPPIGGYKTLIAGGVIKDHPESAGPFPFVYSHAEIADLASCVANTAGGPCVAPLKSDQTLRFQATPADNFLPAGKFVVFTTSLVGVLSGNVPGPVLYTWDWLSSYNGTVGGASQFSGSRSGTSVDSGNGNGGVTILSKNGVPVVDGPYINVNGVVNAGNYASGVPVAPGSIAAVFGNFLLKAPFAANNLPLPQSLAGLSIQFDQLKAPLFYASGGQVNVQIPWELTSVTQTSITASLNSQSGIPQAVALQPFAPSLFSTNGQGTGAGAIQDTSYRLIDSSNPARAGSTVVIYCTGLGPVTNRPPTGSPSQASPLAETTTAPTVTIGGVKSAVGFSGLAPGLVGLYQVNVQVPPVAGSALPVVLSIGGVTSNTVTIAVSSQP